MQHGDHCGLCYRGDQTLFQRRRRRDAERMPIETTLAEELSRFQNADHGFLALVGDDDDLHPAFLNIKNRIRHFALSEDDLVGSEGRYRFPRPNSGEKFLRVKRLPTWLVCHGVLGPPKVRVSRSYTLAAKKIRCFERRRRKGL